MPSFLLIVLCFTAIVSAKNVVMPWMCLERCDEDINSDLLQFYQNTDTLSAVSYEDYDLGYNGTFVYNEFTSVNGKIQSMGLLSYPMITTATIYKLRELFADPSTFISDAVDAAVTYGYTGYNIDFEPEDGGTNDDAIAYVAFLNTFADALHAQGITITVDVASWNVFWNFTLLAETSVDKIITMDTYAESYSTFVSDLETEVAIFGSKLGVGFDNEYTMPITEFNKRMALVESLGCNEVDIWQAPVTDEWWDGLLAFANGDY